MASVLLCVVSAGCSSRSATKPPRERQQASASEIEVARNAIADAKAHGIKAYYLGDAFDGIHISHYTTDAWGTGVIYGSCDPGPGEGGCSPPIQLVTYGAILGPIDPQIESCIRLPDQRRAAIVALTDPGNVRRPGDQLEVLTASQSVTIAHQPSVDPIRAVASLQSIDGSITPNDPLPAPSAKSLAWLKENCQTAR